MRGIVVLVVSVHLLVACCGCQRVIDRPVRRSLPGSSQTGTASTRRLPRPVPVVIRPPAGFQLAAAERRLATDLPQSTSILPVAAALPVDSAANGVPRRLPHHRSPAAASLAADIQATWASYSAAFNRHDPVTLAAHWTADGENVDLDTGSRTVGREAVERVFDRLFTVDDAARIDFEIEAVRPIRDDVAVVDGISRLALTERQPACSRFSAVLVRHDDRWLIETVREAAAPADPTIRDRLTPLAWLRGSWEDISDGLTVSMQCDWADDGCFLIRQHLITEDPQHPGAAERTAAGIPALLPTAAFEPPAELPVKRRTITEFIGWDENRGEIRSWLFCSDGRTAEFSWLRTGTGWLLEQDAGNAQSAAEQTRLTLTQVGDDELTLQRSSGGPCDLLPAADFVRTARPLAPADARAAP